jgi:hypothetical protein
MNGIALLRGRFGRGVAVVAALLTAAPTVYAQTPTSPADGPNLTFAEAMSGKTLPLTRKLSDLNGADWRRVTVRRVSGTQDAVNATVTAAILGPAGGLVQPAAHFTQGQTVTVEGKPYLVTYVWNPKKPDLTALMRGGSTADLPEPERLTADSVLTLCLLNVAGIRGIEDIRPFDLQAEIAGSEAGGVSSPFQQARQQAMNTSSLSNLKQLGTAAIMYCQDYDERFPPMKSAADTKRCLFPYVKNDEAFRHPDSKKPYLPNPFVSGKTMAAIERPAELVIYYEPDVAADGKRGAVFADGHAKRLTEDEWEKAAMYSKIPFVRVRPE